MPIQNGDKVFGVDCGLWVEGIYSRQNADGSHRIRVGKLVVNTDYVEPKNPQEIRRRERDAKKLANQDEYDTLAETYKEYA